MNVFNTGVIFTPIAFILCRKSMAVVPTGAQWGIITRNNIYFLWLCFELASYTKIAWNIKQILICFETKTSLNSKKMELKSKAVIWRCSVKKGVPKNFKKISEKYLCRSHEELVKAISCEFSGIFRNIYFVEYLWTHTCMK